MTSGDASICAEATNNAPTVETEDVQPRATVLVVERDRVLLTTFAHALRRGGYRALTSMNEAEARHRLSADKPNLVICNFSLEFPPAVLGIISALRDVNREAPIVVLCAGWDNAAMAEALRLGATFYAPRLLSGKELTRMIDALLADPANQNVLAALSVRSELN